jgi:dihydrofolate reductase
MGRKTWDSIPPKFRPLPNRQNIVLSNQRDLKLGEGVEVVDDFGAALAAAQGCFRCFVVGGATLYEMALNDYDCGDVHLTTIDRAFDCDVFFPPLPERFKLAETSEPITENGIRYRFERWEPEPSE